MSRWILPCVITLAFVALCLGQLWGPWGRPLGPRWGRGWGWGRGLGWGPRWLRPRGVTRVANRRQANNPPARFVGYDGCNHIFNVSILNEFCVSYETTCRDMFDTDPFPKLDNCVGCVMTFMMQCGNDNGTECCL